MNGSRSGTMFRYLSAADISPARPDIITTEGVRSLRLRSDHRLISARPADCNPEDRSGTATSARRTLPMRARVQFGGRIVVASASSTKYSNLGVVDDHDIRAVFEGGDFVAPARRRNRG